MTAFQYARHNLSIRVSNELDKEIENAADALKATKTDIVIYALCLMLDPSGKGCPDVEHLPAELRDDFKPPSLSDVLADHFSKPGYVDWTKLLGNNT